MPAVSKAQQRFMGMVHAAQKGEEPASPEVAKVAADMKKSDAKDFASTKHKGLPTHVKEAIKEIIREVLKEKKGISEMNQNDVHFKHIMKLYDKGGDFTKKKVAAVVLKNPKASRSQIVNALLDSDYSDIIEFEDELGFKESIQKRMGSLTRLVHRVDDVAVEAFLKKYPKVKQVMDAIIKKNGSIMNGYKAFLKFKDKQEPYLGGRAEVTSSPTFGDKTFYKYDWGNVKNHWPEIFQHMFVKTHWTDESVNESISKKDIEKLTSHKDLSKFIKVNKSKINSKDFNYIEDEVEALKYLESDYKRGKADRQEVEVAVIDAQDSIKKSMGIKESTNEGLSKDTIVRTLTSDKNAYFLTKDGNGWILDITPKGAQNSTFHQKFNVKDMGKGHLGMKYKLTNESIEEEHDCGCNENHDCGCGGLHKH